LTNASAVEDRTAADQGYHELLGSKLFVDRAAEVLSAGRAVVVLHGVAHSAQQTFDGCVVIAAVGYLLDEPGDSW
jgi:hypothetical protein